ncbi:MAG: CBS domain-containing protein, partial [Firmicutes bacterium]|nr:CBS domain-containing protein [Bacillota bacterium]
MAETNKLFKRYCNFLCDMAELRNAIVHNPHSRKIEPIAEPHPEILKLYEDIKEAVLHPPLALEVLAVQREDIFTTTTDANALYVMQTMGKNSYTHVPVLEGDAMVGVFSENTVFSYLVKNQILALDQDILIGEFAEFIPLDKHESEYFEFVPREATVVDVEELFVEDIRNQKRLSAVFGGKYLAETPQLPTWALPEARSTPPKPSAPKKDKPSAKCADCGKDISERIVAYSSSKYGTP